MTDITNTGLILEGGGMRGVFTCGVLDCFMDNNIHFPYVIGVSAGACNGLSYISKQRGRAKYSNIDLLDKYKYIGIRHYLKKRNIMDFDLLFHEFPDNIIPYDYETYFSSPSRFEMVTSNCLTGKAEYFEEKSDKDRIIEIVKASSSLPILCPVAYVDGIPMLDGGICDAIPIVRAMELGYKRNVVVVTRNKGFRKHSNEVKLLSFLYRKYPAMQEALNNRNTAYNTRMELIEKLEEEGSVCVIRPQNPITVDRIEKDVNKLISLYEEGYECGRTYIQS